MSTRAIIAYASEAGRWKGVYNHSEGHTQYLGSELIERVATFDGDLLRMLRQYVDRCPEGWSSFQEGRRADEGVGFLHGSVTEHGASVDDGIGRSTQYLYVFNVQGRTLCVFNSSPAPVKPFGQVVFDASGAATPAELPRVAD